MQGWVVSRVSSQEVCRCAANYATTWFDGPASAEHGTYLATGVKPIITMSRFAGLVDMTRLQVLLRLKK